MKRIVRKNLPYNLIRKSSLRLSNGVRSRLIYVDDLEKICNFSRSKAYRIINGSQELSPAYEELLKIKLLGEIPGWPVEFSLTDDGEISCPNGYTLDHNMAEQYSFHLQIVNSMASDLKRLLTENKKLNARLDEITKPQLVEPSRRKDTDLKLIKT